MNEQEIIKVLDNLIEDFNDYSTDYTKTTCIYYKEIFIEIKKQLEEKDKVINEAIKYIRKNTIVNTIFQENENELLEILEGGKND